MAQPGSGARGSARWQQLQMQARPALAGGTRASRSASKRREAHQQSAGLAPGEVASAQAFG
jgi:hypothetical protein